ASLLRYERLAHKSKEKESAKDVGAISVRLKLLDETDFSHYGRMDFVDNVIERSTGTIRGRAQFANSDGLFTPGMFGRVQMPGSGRRGRPRATPPLRSRTARKPRPTPRPRPIEGRRHDAHFTLLHRSSNLRGRRLGDLRDRRRRVVLAPAGRAISRDRAADHQ